MDDARKQTAKPPSWRRNLVLVLWSLSATFVLLETGLRLATTDVGGFRRLLGVDLLPLPLVTPVRERGLVEAAPYLMADPTTGWTVRPHGRSADGLYEANALGLRSSREVPLEKGGAYRILVVGDSLAHGDDVTWEDTWVRKLGAALPEGVEVWCGAVPAFGTDQALLRLDQLLLPVSPDLVILTIYRQNLLRNLTFFRSLQHPKTGICWSKPRFTEADTGRLVLRNQPTVPPEHVVQTLENYSSHPLSRDDLFWFPDLYAPRSPWEPRLLTWIRSRRRTLEFAEVARGYLSPGGAAVRLETQLVTAFLANMKTRGLEARVVVLSDEEDVQARRDQPDAVPPFVSALRDAGVPLIDTTPSLADCLSEDEPVSVLFVGGRGHPNGRATGVIAAEIRAALDR